MDCQKTGKLITTLRKEKGMTQKEIADKMNISDKTISKWERGLGCPDVSLLCELADILGIEVEKLLNGDLSNNMIVGGNMKKIKYYVCPICGNIITSTGEASISCCGRKLEEIVPEKADDNHKIKVEISDDDWYFTSEHEMSKNHYISFIAIATSEKLILIKQYPEWNLQTRVHKHGHGMLLNYCTKHGLFYQMI